jgi:hypothetical protein
MTGRVAETSGRKRSNGGKATGSERTLMTGEVISTPRGLLVGRHGAGDLEHRLLVQLRDHRHEVGVVADHLGQPDRSRIIAKATDLSCLRRWSHPANVTVSPTCSTS